MSKLRRRRRIPIIITLKRCRIHGVRHIVHCKSHHTPDTMGFFIRVFLGENSLSPGFVNLNSNPIPEPDLISWSIPNTYGIETDEEGNCRLHYLKVTRVRWAELAWPNLSITITTFHLEFPDRKFRYVFLTWGLHCDIYTATAFCRLNVHGLISGNPINSWNICKNYLDQICPNFLLSWFSKI